MTQARQIIPGTTYFVTRRCAEQRFFLRPSAFVNQVFSFCAGIAAEHYRMQIHAICVMSNHWHAVVTDEEGNLPRFMEWVHKYVAKCLNLSLGRRENFWSCHGYSAIALDTEAEVMDKMVYTLGNPVRAKLVKRASDWPGWTTTDWGTEEQTLARPGKFFRENGPVPRQCTLRLTVPRAFQNTGESAFWETVSRHVREYESQYHQEHRGKVLGIKRVLAQSPFSTPKKIQRAFSRNWKASGKSKKVLAPAIERVRAFTQSYRVAYERFKAGFHDTLFPFGTYWMRLHAGAVCVPG